MWFAKLPKYMTPEGRGWTLLEHVRVPVVDFRFYTDKWGRLAVGPEASRFYLVMNYKNEPPDEVWERFQKRKRRGSAVQSSKSAGEKS